MTTSRRLLLKNSFSGGEVSPELYARVDDDRYQTSTARMENFISLPHGPATNRAGTLFIGLQKNQAENVGVKLIPYSDHLNGSVLLEFGHKYIRVYRNGVRESNKNEATGETFFVELPTPYKAEHVKGLKYAQSNKILTIVHALYPAYELSRTYAINALKPTKGYWDFQPVQYQGGRSACPSVTVTPAPSTEFPAEAYYMVTAIDEYGSESSDLKDNLGAGVGGEDMLRTALIKWAQTASLANDGKLYFDPVREYRIYKRFKDSSQWGLCGQIGGDIVSRPVDAGDGKTNKAKEYKFADVVSSNPDYMLSPCVFPENLHGSNDAWWNGYEEPGPDKERPFYDFPSTVAYFEQRKCFASTLRNPQMIWMARPGTGNDMGYHAAIMDDDAVFFRIAAQDAGVITHLVPMQSLVILTQTSEWKCPALRTDHITPRTLSARLQSYHGSNFVQPLVVGRNVLYVESSSQKVRELGFSNEADSYVSGDVCMRALHLFEGRAILDMAFTRSPYPVAWMVSNDGSLLGFTYMPEHRIGSWHRHFTGGFSRQNVSEMHDLVQDKAHIDAFESICCVYENNQDVLYAGVVREFVKSRNADGTVDTKIVRTIEKFAPRLTFDSNTNMHFTDCGMYWTADDDGGLNVTKVSATRCLVKGLDHLEGQLITAAADGVPQGSFIVKNGQILIHSAPKFCLTAGIPFQSFIQTLPLSPMTRDDFAYGQGVLKNVNKVFLRVHKTYGLRAGPSDTRMRHVISRSNQDWWEPYVFATDELEILLDGDWNSTGQVTIAQFNPIPATLLSIVFDATFGAV